MLNSFKVAQVQLHNNIKMSIEEKMERWQIRYTDMARILKISKSRMTAIKSDFTKLNLITLMKVVRSVGLKMEVVIYDDNDSRNELGFVEPGIFNICWSALGSPRSYDEVRDRLTEIGKLKRANLQK